ncbi:MAG: hypothetical protein R3C01_04950 [Planctomycetaceae bacterium]
MLCLKRSLSTLCLLCVAVVARAENGAAVPAASEPQSLPVLDLAFIENPATEGEREIIAMRILEDGRVLLPNERTGRMEVVSRMAPDELQKLTSEMLHDHGLPGLRSENLKQEISTLCQQQGFDEHISGAAATAIRLRDQKSIHFVRCPAVSIAAARFPECADVQNMFAIQLRLQNVAAVARAGGVDAAKTLARQANQILQQTQPLSEPLEVNDLAMVRELPSGRRYVQFYRKASLSSNGPGTEEAREGVLVSMFDDPGQAPRVSVMYESAIAR